MTDCMNIEIRDALPDLVHGRLGKVDTATLTGHVESCDACAAEVALLREVRASAPIAPRIDVARIVAALPLSTNVVGPTSGESDRSSRFRVRPVFLQLVVAAAIVIAGALVFNGDERNSEIAAARVAVSPSSATVTATPGVAAESSAGSSPEKASLSLVAGVQELSDEEIETLLGDLEGIESIPAAEPQAVPLTLDYLEVEG